MAISSSMLPLGTRAPDFALPDVVTGKTVSNKDFAGSKALLVMFICKHCPYVVHVQEELPRIANDYSGKGVGIVAVSANDVERYPEDAPEQLKAMAENLGFRFPFCYDETQTVAIAFNAACTPDFFLFDAEQRLVYRGQLDDTRPGRGIANGRDLRGALDAVLGGTAVNRDQKPGIGCSIKWKGPK